MSRSANDESGDCEVSVRSANQISGGRSDRSLFRSQVFRSREQRLAGEVRIARPPSFVWLTWLIASIVALSAIVLASGDYSRRETVRGFIEPDTGLIRVKPAAAGMVMEILVEEGQEVRAGQALARLSGEQFLAGGSGISATRIQSLEERKARIENRLAEVEAGYAVDAESIVSQLSIVDDKIARAARQIRIVDERIAINRELLRLRESLQAKGHESELNIVRQQDLLLSLEQELESGSLNLANLEEQRILLALQRANAPGEHAAEIDALMLQLEETHQELQRAQLDRNAELKAPVAGTVSGLTAVRGQNITPADTLMHVLPVAADLLVVLYVPSASVGLIQQGQIVNMRFDAFPYQRFGVYQGEVMNIGKTPLFPDEYEGGAVQQGAVFRITVSLPLEEIEALGQGFPLRPGMTLEADIVTEERSLLYWLFDPILSIQRKLQ